MIPLLSRWRLGAMTVALIAAAVLLLLLQHERRAREAAEYARDNAVAAAEVAASQVTLDRTTSRAAAAAQNRTLTIVTRSEEAAHAVLDLPGAEQALPEAVRDAWAAGVLSLRKPAPNVRRPDPAGG